MLTRADAGLQTERPDVRAYRERPMINYMFRKPKYPVLIETDHWVVGARNAQKIERLLGRSAFANKESYIVIDSSGEGWCFVPELVVISPLTLQKSWNKPKIINFFNSSLAQTGCTAKYQPRSLSNTRLDRLVDEMVEFEKKLQQVARARGRFRKELSTSRPK